MLKDVVNGRIAAEQPHWGCFAEALLQRASDPRSSTATAEAAAILVLWKFMPFNARLAGNTILTLHWKSNEKLKILQYKKTSWLYEPFRCFFSHCLVINLVEGQSWSVDLGLSWSIRLFNCKRTSQADHCPRWYRQAINDKIQWLEKRGHKSTSF